MQQFMEKEEQRVALERDAQAAERVLAQGERAVQSFERKEAQTERHDARDARLMAEQQRRTRESSSTPCEPAHQVFQTIGRFLDLLNWADSSPMQKRTAGQLSDGSAQWIFDRKEFVRWISSGDPGGGLLWYYGNGDATSVYANVS